MALADVREQRGVSITSHRRGERRSVYQDLRRRSWYPGPRCRVAAFWSGHSHERWPRAFGRGHSVGASDRRRTVPRSSTS